jgi:hypothetical protein
VLAHLKLINVVPPASLTHSSSPDLSTRNQTNAELIHDIPPDGRISVAGSVDTERSGSYYSTVSRTTSVLMVDQRTERQAGEALIEEKRLALVRARQEYQEALEAQELLLKRQNIKWHNRGYQGGSTRSNSIDVRDHRL